MFVVTLECAEAESELLSAELWDAGASGIEEQPLPERRSRLRAWFDRDGDWLEQFRPWSPVVAVEAERDWVAEVRRAWQPYAVGERLYVAPEWDEAPAGRVRLTVHPGQALGTGAHPATRLCLQALERHLQPGEAVLDVGTGSGILVAAAHLLGAGCAVGCDIETEAAGIARRNLIADEVPPRVFAGSVRSVRALSFDLVVANLNATTHASLAGEYGRVARRAAIVSGFPQMDQGKAERAMGAVGFRVVETLKEEKWICVVLCREESSLPR
jgi:ribosomal protein L11 methyltransferase